MPNWAIIRRSLMTDFVRNFLCFGDFWSNAVLRITCLISAPGRASGQNIDFWDLPVKGQRFGQMQRPRNHRAKNLTMVSFRLFPALKVIVIHTKTRMRSHPGFKFETEFFPSLFYISKTSSLHANHFR